MSGEESAYVPHPFVRRGCSSGPTVASSAIRPAPWRRRRAPPGSPFRLGMPRAKPRPFLHNSIRHVLWRLASKCLPHPGGSAGN